MQKRHLTGSECVYFSSRNVQSLDLRSAVHWIATRVTHSTDGLFLDSPGSLSGHRKQS